MLMKKLMLSAIFSICLAFCVQAGEKQLINNGWTFHLGTTSVPDDVSVWEKVSLPHDWTAGHPDGGENLTGWYRRSFFVQEWEKGRNISVRFDGMSGEGELFCNGMHISRLSSDNTSIVYDLTPYVKYGGDNVLTVSIEGEGISRDVYLLKSSSVFVPEFSTRVWTNFGKVYATTTVVNKDYLIDATANVSVTFNVLDIDGKKVATSTSDITPVKPFDSQTFDSELHVSIPHMWDLDDPYMYTLNVVVTKDGRSVDEVNTKFGVRDIVFDRNRGFVLNNRRVALHGVTVPGEHSGVGTAVPKELWRYRLNKFKELGVNALRCVGEPASQAMLDVCDELGLLVVDDCGLTGVNEEQLSALRRMIESSFNHPSVIMWNLGDGDRNIDSRSEGHDIILHLTEFAHHIDPSRPTTYAGCEGSSALGASDVNGYNQASSFRPDADHTGHEFWKAVGLFESVGKGNDSHTVDVIRFYEERKWLAGMFFDSEGILDLCSSRKDEAYYLQSCWTWVPVIHICGARDGQIRVYSNCVSVDLSVNGRSLGRKQVPENGFVSWPVTAAKLGKVVAKGEFKGTLPRSINIQETYTPVPNATLTMFSKDLMKADGQDILVVDITSGKSTVPVTVAGPVEILGKGDARELSLPTSSGRAQIILRSIEGQQGQVTVRVDGKDKTLFSY